MSRLSEIIIVILSVIIFIFAAILVTFGYEWLVECIINSDNIAANAIKIITVAGYIIVRIIISLTMILVIIVNVIVPVWQKIIELIKKSAEIIKKRHDE